MGAGISMAHGMQKANEALGGARTAAAGAGPQSDASGQGDAGPRPRKVVGIVGDSTFFHSGITGLLDIAYNQGAATIIVVDNRTTAMTGHQEHPGTGRTVLGEQTVSATVEDFGRACGMKNIATVDPYDVKATTDVIRTALESEEPWLIVARSPCPLYTKKNPGSPRQVDQELCRKCKACLKLGCPAIEWVNDEIHVNELLCGGCTLCEQVCKDGAFAIANAGQCHE